MPADPTRVKAIFLEAAELPDAAARAAYLDRACGADAGLRERVEALFRSHDPAGSFLGTPAAVIPDPDHAATRAFEPDPDHAATRTGGGSSSDDEVPLGFLAPGTRPDSLGRIGHYEVLQVLGQGGFGIVFRAFDDVLHRVVAVKVLAPQLAATSPARKRFLREARSSAQVRHENVVQVYEVGETPLPYIAMEFIPGETLQERLNRVGPVDPAEVLRVGRQIAEGLAAAHATDLIHRDIKPGNILLEGGAGRVKITDFGLARAADDASISQSGVIAGTPMYMAPEQAKGDKLDRRADLFSLGSVLYQMACGRPPFRANSTVAVLKRVCDDTPRDIREVVPEVPQWLCDIISKLHAKNPADRFQSAREVADVLADCEAQLKANAKLKDFSRIPKSKQPAAGKSGRWKWVAAAALLLPLIAFAMTELAGVTHLFRVVTVQPAGPAESQVPDDKARLQGRWRMVAHEQNGKPLPVGEHVFGYRVEFIGDTHVAYHADGKPLSLPFVLNPGADPKEIDYLTLQAPIRSIYRFDGDKLIIAMGGPGPGRPRPTGFTTTPDTSFSVGTLVRDTGPMPGQTGWVPLFNGKDLTGWKTHPDQPGTWDVKDGILIGSSRQSYLFSERGDYVNFHLRAVAKINLGGDSGIIFRAPFALLRGELAWQVAPAGCYQAELQKSLTHPNPTGSVSQSTGDTPPIVLGRAADDSLTRPDEWFTLEIIAEQNRFITKVNGKETANCSDPLNKYPTGHFALEVWNPNTVVQFRKIEIKELPSVPGGQPGPTAAPSPEAKTPPTVVAPFTDADVKRIAALPAAEQIVEVRKELMRRNPGFDGKLEHKIEDGVVTEFHVLTDNVMDIAPVRVLTGMVYLDLRGTYPNKGKLSDLSPLKGMRLSRLDCSSTQIADLTPLAGVPLTTLQVNHNPVADLTPLKGMPLEHLGIAETKVSDLSPLKGLKLKTLGAQLLPVTDLSPLEGMPLTGLDLYHTVGVTKLDALKGMPLEGLNVQDLPVKDLAPLKDMSTLRSLQLVATEVSDLSPLAGLKLTDLILGGNQITDLSPLKGLPLKRLHFSGTGVRDLRPLKGMSLDEIRLNPKNITQGLDVLRGMKSLKTIGIEGNKVWPAAEFWERYDKGEFKE